MNDDDDDLPFGSPDRPDDRPEDEHDPMRCEYCGEHLESAEGHHWNCPNWEPGDPYIG